MRLVDTRAYVGMLKELVEQGKEVRMVISTGEQRTFANVLLTVGCA